MSIIAIIKNNIVIDVIEIDTLEKAIEQTGKECIDISNPVNITLLNGTVMPAWIGINWKKEKNTWIPPFDLDIPLSFFENNERI